MANQGHHELYNIWNGIKKRCLKVYCKDYNAYGNSGIKICKRWLKFPNFLEDMGPRPSTKHTVDRINNKLGYSKGNCRWATRDEQTKNRRLKFECMRGGHSWTKENTLWTHNGVGKSRRCKACYEKRISNQKIKSTKAVAKEKP